jgi:hypothetical protein
MEISIKQLVMLCLGLFLLKITVADPYRQGDNTQSRSPSSVRTVGPGQSRGLKGALVKQGRFSEFQMKKKVLN